MATIDIGDSLPSLTLKNEKDEDVQVENLASEKGVILFLVPKADTRTYWFTSGDFAWILNLARATFLAGCTNQACGFRDIYPDFTSLNYDVYCLSADTPAAQTKWQTKVSLGLFSRGTLHCSNLISLF